MDDFRQHTTRARRQSRQVQRDADITIADTPAEPRPRRISLAQLARQQSLAVHVDNWRDDDLHHKHLPMQHIVSSLSRDVEVPVRSKRQVLQPAKAARSSGIHPALISLDYFAGLDAPETNVSEQAWVHDDVQTPVDNFIDDWYLSQRQATSSSPSDQFESLTESEGLDTFFDFDAPTDHPKPRL